MTEREKDRVRRGEEDGVSGGEEYRGRERWSERGR